MRVGTPVPPLSLSRMAWLGGADPGRSVGQLSVELRDTMAGADVEKSPPQAHPGRQYLEGGGDCSFLCPGTSW